MSQLRSLLATIESWNDRLRTFGSNFVFIRGGIVALRWHVQSICHACHGPDESPINPNRTRNATCVLSFGAIDDLSNAGCLRRFFLINYQTRPKVKRKLIAATYRFGFPSDCARSVIDTDQFFAIVEIDS